ncbi:MAG: hypothetical protein AB7S26_08765 [Sandaracinaceae bacterium]
MQRCAPTSGSRFSAWQSAGIQAVFGMLVLGASALGGAGCAGNDGAPCDPTCGDFEVCCNGACAFTTADPLNCGGCGIACPSGICNAGTCMPGGGTDGSRRDGGGSSMCGTTCNDTGMSATQRCCGGACIGRTVPPGTAGTSDPSFMNCNGCGISCNVMTANSCSVPGGGTMGMARCMCGEFDACRADEQCVNEGGTYMCVSTSTDPHNCGMLGHECAMGETCIGGNCQCGSSGSPCGSGEACCAGACRPTLNDPMNCGGCGVVCGPNAPECMSGSCVCAAAGRACRMATAPMGGFPIPIPLPIPGASGDPGELCCATGCVNQDSTNCGMCGNMCGTEEECGVATPLLGGPAEVCCLESGGIGGLLGCGGSGFPFPFPDGGGIPGLDGGLPFP